MKVATVIITDKYVEPRCYSAAVSQTYDNNVVIVYQERPPNPDTSNEIVNLYRACAKCRESARRLAIAAASDADAFLFVDSDIVIPSTAVEEFVKQSRGDERVIGGWYKIRNDQRYACGRWIADNVFVNLTRIEYDVVKVDMVGLGCAFVPRSVLELIEFRHGTDLICKNALSGLPLIVGECGAFGNDVYALGAPMFMTSHVVCEHLSRAIPEVA